MPQEPKKNHSKARKRTRRAAIFLTEIATLNCSNCGALIQPHIVCKKCGFYDGKQITTANTQVKVTKA